MTTLYLETIIKAPVEKVFDLSRSVDHHLVSASQTSEKAVAGKTSGLLELNEWVTWKGKHFGIWLKHTSIITEFESPVYFVDKMQKGHFKFMEHHHIFKQQGSNTLMIDRFVYKVPYGFTGKILNKLLLKNYMRKFLKARNNSIKKVAEVSLQN
jgi:ligand-binding SRPBCC domain-containing protein